MACRVGITTNPERRKEEWKREHPRLRNWKQRKVGSREKAQKIEDRIAIRRNCSAHHGGSSPNKRKPWYVYCFEH